MNGEAFFITDEAPIPIWDFQRKIGAVASDKTPLADVHFIPAWVGMAMATMVEFLFLIFTLGQKLPPKTLRRDVPQYAISNRTFCVDKAKERLGYKPLIDTNEGIKRGVEWALKNQVHHDGKVASTNRSAENAFATVWRKLSHAFSIRHLANLLSLRSYLPQS